MNDITELAQLRAELSNPAIGSKDHLRKLALSLVEALEKAQQENTYGVAGMAESYETTISMLRSRIAELERQNSVLADGVIRAEQWLLESRTVKLPPKIERNDADGWFMYNGGRVGGGAAEWYNKALDDVGAELSAAGIKWEAE